MLTCCPGPYCVCPAPPPVAELVSVWGRPRGGLVRHPLNLGLRPRAARRYYGPEKAFARTRSGGGGLARGRGLAAVEGGGGADGVDSLVGGLRAALALGRRGAGPCAISRLLFASRGERRMRNAAVLVRSPLMRA